MERIFESKLYRREKARRNFGCPICPHPRYRSRTQVSYRLSGLQDFGWTKTSHFFSDLLPGKLCFVAVYLGTPLMGGANCSALRTE